MASTEDQARKVKVITVNAQVKIIQIVAIAEIVVAVVIVLSQVGYQIPFYTFLHAT